MGCWLQGKLVPGEAKKRIDETLIFLISCPRPILDSFMFRKGKTVRWFPFLLNSEDK